MPLMAAMSDSDCPCKENPAVYCTLSCVPPCWGFSPVSAGGLLAPPPPVCYFCLRKWNEEIKTAYSPGKYKKSLVLASISIW